MVEPAEMMAELWIEVTTEPVITEVCQIFCPSPLREASYAFGQESALFSATSPIAFR